METYEDIQEVLNAFGITMTFPAIVKVPPETSIPGFTLLGIPSFYTEILNGQGDSSYPVEQQAYNFQVSLSDAIDKNIAPDDKFTTTDGVYTYTYQINDGPISYTDGWARLFVDQLSRASI